MKFCALLLAIILGIASVAAVLLDGNDGVKSLAEHETEYKRTFAVSDRRGRSHSVPVLLSREVVEKSEKGFGISKEELRKDLIREAERFTDQHGWKFKVNINKDLSYLVLHTPGTQHLTKEYKRLYDQVTDRYYKEHFFVVKNNLIQVNYPALQKWQAPELRPVYESLYSIAKSSSLNEREFISLMANFVQRLPYKIPPDEQNDRQINGVWPPIVCLKEGSGDCDTKSTLFATIYTHYRKNGSIIIFTPQHAFIGIKDQHRVFPRDKSIKIGGREYLLAEMTNPFEIGQISSDVMSQLKIGKFRYMEMN